MEMIEGIWCVLQWFIGGIQQLQVGLCIDLVDVGDGGVGGLGCFQDCFVLVCWGSEVKFVIVVIG